MILYCITESDSIDTGPCKIGVTSLHISKRLGQLQTGNYRKFEVAWAIKPYDRDFTRSLEQSTLTRFRPDLYLQDNKTKLQSEWIDTSPIKAFEWVQRLLGIADIAFSVVKK